jgi:hypothetical protein
MDNMKDTKIISNNPNLILSKNPQSDNRSPDMANFNMIKNEKNVDEQKTCHWMNSFQNPIINMHIFYYSCFLSVTIVIFIILLNVFFKLAPHISLIKSEIKLCIKSNVLWMI